MDYVMSNWKMVMTAVERLWKQDRQCLRGETYGTFAPLFP